MKILGPYLRPDNRKHLIIINEDGTKTSKSYPKQLLEDKLGRRLLPNETADHINNDKTDDRLENLQVLTLSENAKKEMQRPERARKFITFQCPVCGNNCTKPENYIKGNLKKGKAGPFCSRKCAGKGTYINPWN